MIDEYVVERLEMIVLVFPVEKRAEVVKELAEKHPDYQCTWSGSAGAASKAWSGKNLFRMIVNYPKPEQREGTYTAAENAALDAVMPSHEKLVALAKANPPPASWYEEEFESPPAS